MKVHLRRTLCLFLSLCMVMTMMPIIPSVEGKAYGETNQVQWISIHDQQGGGESVKYEDLSTNLDHLEAGGWMWDAESQTLLLRGFKGTSIRAEGDLHIRLDGKNQILGSDVDGIYVESGSLTIDKTTDDLQDKLHIDITQTKAGTVYNRTTMYASEIMLFGGSIDADYRLQVSKPYSGTFSGFVRGVGGNVSVYNGANLDVQATSNQSVSGNIGVDKLNVYGSGTIQVELDAIYDNAHVENVIGVTSFYASNLSTATVIIDAENHAKPLNAVAVDNLEGVHFDQGGSLEIRNGYVYGAGNFYTGILADNIVVTPSEYIFFFPGSSSQGKICDPAGNALFGQIQFTGVAKEQPLHFQEGSAWNLPVKKVGSSYLKYLTGGLGGRHTEDMRFVVTKGELPAGLRLEERGYITGNAKRPCDPGTVEITIYREESALETFVINYEGVTGPMLTINDEEYYAGESASGENWSYDSIKKVLKLDGFTGTYIGCDNELTIVVTNENYIVPVTNGKSCGINIKGDLQLTGSGKLTIKQDAVKEDTFCGIYSTGKFTLTANTVEIQLKGENGLTGICAKESTTVQDSDLSISVSGNQGTGIQNKLVLRSKEQVSIDVFGITSAVGVGQLTSTEEYLGNTSLHVSQAEGNGSAVGKLSTIKSAPGGQIHIEKGLVCVNSLEWNGLDYNVILEPAGWRCKAVTSGEDGAETFVLADAQGTPLDGGMTFHGLDLNLEQPVSFTVDESWTIPEMTVYEKITKIDFRENVIIEDNSTVSFEIIEGSLPEGITLHESGYVSGTPKVPCDAGQVRIQLYDDGEVIPYIEPFTLSYGRVYGKDTALTIDGTTYSRRTDLEGAGWSYDVITQTLLLDGYEGGAIEAEKELTIQLKGTNIIQTNGTETKYAGVYVQNGDLHIRKTESDTEDALTIVNEADQESDIYGIYMQNGFIEFYGGSLNIQLHNQTGAAKGTYHMNLMRVYDGANLTVNVCSAKRSAVGVERMSVYGNGNITVNVQGNAVWSKTSYALDNLSFEDETGANMLIHSTLVEDDGDVIPGIATMRLSKLDFAPGGRLDVQQGVIQFLFEPVTSKVKVEPSAYYVDGYMVTPETEVCVMHNAEGLPITENISFAGTEEEQPLVFTPNPKWRLEDTKAYEFWSISFESGFGKRNHDVEYKVVEGALPEGMDFVHCHDLLEGYPIKTGEASEVTIAVICDDVEINRFVLPYGAVSEPDENRIPVIRFYEDEHELILGESYRFSYEIDNFEPAFMDIQYISSDESIGTATCIVSSVYPADFHSYKAGVVTITLALNLEGIAPASATFYVREKTPKAYFDQGVIKGLDPNGTYEINQELHVADQNGWITVEEAWSDSRVRIRKIHEEPRCNSDIQTLYVLTESNVVVDASDLTYSGEALTPQVLVKYGEKNLIEDKDYQIIYNDNVNAGLAKVTIAGMGEYGGTVEKSFRIQKASLLNCQATLSTCEYTYSGSAKKPSVSVPGLKEGKDYVVSYKNNTNAGEATAIVSGIGNYGDKKNLTFQILPKKISSVKLSTTCYVYNGKIKKPAVTVKSGRKTILNRKYNGNSAVQVTYAKGRKNPGTYKVTVKGTGNYTGEISKTFFIKVKNTSISSITSGSKQFTVKWRKLSSTYISGYQIRYSRYSDMRNATKTELQKRTTTKKVTGLKAKKYYYVQIRSYKTVNGKKYYSDWSKSKKVKTKS